MPLPKLNLNADGHLQSLKNVVNKVRGKDNKKDNETESAATLQHRKQFRQISDDERAVAPDVGEHGWGHRSWPSVRRELKVERIRPQQDQSKNEQMSRDEVHAVKMAHVKVGRAGATEKNGKEPPTTFQGYPVRERC